MTSSGDYEVGYGKPPKQHQFKKGQTGNRRGRPQKHPKREPLTRQPSLTAHVLEESRRVIPIAENGKVSHVPVAQAAVRKMVAMGLGGNRIALQNVLKLAQAAEREETSIHAEGNQILSDIKNAKYQELEAVRAAGGDESEVLPHPDDIQFHKLLGIAFVIGPQDLREKAEWDKMAALKRELEADLEADFAERAAEGDNEILDHEIALGQWHLAYIDTLYPDEATRRAPDFPLEMRWPPDFSALPERPRFKPAKRAT